jgi:hypothetical protein
MLRLLALALILANGAYFAWSEGLLRAYGMGPALQREPQRTAQQIAPEALRVLSVAELQRAEAQAQAELAPKECLLAGPFDDAQVAVLRRALESSLGAGGWQVEPVVVPSRWIVYIGKFANADALHRKRAELTALHLSPQAVATSALEPGLSLGGFDTQAAAVAELARLGQRGVRTARVVQERQEAHLNQLRLPAVSEVLKQRLGDLKPALAGKALTPCK